jgi:protein-S-isoprenylcysteine O-methyltransferase Ste14
MSPWLVVKNILFAILVPGSVAGYLPYLLLRRSGDICRPVISSLTVIAGIIGLLGIGVAAHCIWEFAFHGQGTPAPFDPPKKLVARGVYRHMRNPMYTGMLLMLIGETLLFLNRDMLIYAIAAAAGFHLYVLLLEEPRLRKRFGESYDEYCRTVPRWGFKLSRQSRV